MQKRFLSNAECLHAAYLMAQAIEAIPGLCASDIKIYGVPRGGIPVSYLVCVKRPYQFVLTTECDKASVIVDDIVDSGRTKQRYERLYEDTPFFALADYLQTPRKPGEWLVFPWEVGEKDQSADDIVTRLLQYIGEDPNRGGLLETPERVLKAWKQWTAGYAQDPKEVLKVFEDGAEGYDELVLVRDIPFYSHCEHHLAPFFGTATIGYIPDGKIVGLSKLGRLLEVFARRLQVQERLTVQIADAIVEHLRPKGVAVILHARHLCMESRGLQKQGHVTITSALRGILKDNKARSEFLALVNSQ